MQHFARHRPVIFWEEPVAGSDDEPSRLDLRRPIAADVLVAAPVLPGGLSADRRTAALRGLLDDLLAAYPAPAVCWYGAPTMLPFSQHLGAACVVYDCTDDLATSPNAPHGALEHEDALIARADLVFTDTDTLFEAMRGRHPAVHAADKPAGSPPCDGPAGDVPADPPSDHAYRKMADLIEAVIARAANGPIGSRSAALVGRASAYDVLVVGAGFAGAVMAERLAADGGKRVLVVDRRPHIAGNAFDRIDDAGILIHQYGPHIFHTNSADIVAYLSRFTEWRPYEHRVLADVNGLLVPMPINRTTLNRLYGCNLASDAEAQAFLTARAEPVEVIRTSADVVISAVGRELYRTFFQGYTRKQWGVDPSELDKSVTARVPTRTSTDDRYFTDSFQAMPAEGFTAMFERMLDHPNIDLLLGAEYTEAARAHPHDHLVFTGPIDEYFGHRFGKLPYRSLEFRHETRDVEYVQPVAVVNYPSQGVPYTRITEYKHLTGQVAPRSSITYEYPRAEGDPYYPIPRPENQALFKRYEALALAEQDVTFVGRLATYRYYNMDQVVGQALATYRRAFAQTVPAGSALLPAQPTSGEIAA